MVINDTSPLILYLYFVVFKKENYFLEQPMTIKKLFGGTTIYEHYTIRHFHNYCT